MSTVRELDEMTEITSDIPAPVGPVPHRQYQFPHLKVGESFAVSPRQGRQMQIAASRFKAGYPWWNYRTLTWLNPKTRVMETRIWRLEDSDSDAASTTEGEG